MHISLLVLHYIAVVPCLNKFTFSIILQTTNDTVLSSKRSSKYNIDKLGVHAVYCVCVHMITYPPKM